jgi:hypothetical protein
MVQQGQVFKLKTKGADGKPLWACKGERGSPLTDSNRRPLLTMVAVGCHRLRIGTGPRSPRARKSSATSSRPAGS